MIITLESGPLDGTHTRLAADSEFLAAGIFELCYTYERIGTTARFRYVKGPPLRHVRSHEAGLRDDLLDERR
jgi:hypothetical protein